MAIKMLLNNDFFLKIVQMILHYQNEINVIMYIIEVFFKTKLESFHLDKNSIKFYVFQILCFYHVLNEVFDK